MSVPLMTKPPSLRLASLVQAGWADLQARFGARINSRQIQALQAIRDCRSGAFGMTQWQCPNCAAPAATESTAITANASLWLPLACGHRSCPRCQNHQATAWLARQQKKLLPLPYFLVTFTLPKQLRALAVAAPKVVFPALFQASSATLQWFGKHRAGLDQMGFCTVLHTHSRRLDVHPHVHVVVPGGGLVRQSGGGLAFQRTGRRYLFNARALAAGFRKRLLALLQAAGLVIPEDVPARWIVDCRRAGDGTPALAYLSRYLYRGVIAEPDLLGVDAARGTVTFQYREGRDGQARGKRRTRTMTLAGFLYLLCLHVLPTGLHRVRCYGFWHANAGKSLRRLQLMLRVSLPPGLAAGGTLPARPGVCCPCCDQPMRLVTILRPARVAALS